MTRVTPGWVSLRAARANFAERGNVTLSSTSRTELNPLKPAPSEIAPVRLAGLSCGVELSQSQRHLITEMARWMTTRSWFGQSSISVFPLVGLLQEGMAEANRQPSGWHSM